VRQAVVGNTTESRRATVRTRRTDLFVEEKKVESMFRG
jgi:hypothetical protein